MNLKNKPAVAFGASAVLAVLLPFIFTDDFAVSVFCSMSIAILLALSYNMLLGQGGMMSFGHAVYSGLGAYMTMHALNGFGAAGIAFPVTLLPLIGGASGLGFGALFGYLMTKRSGTPFAMISLGIGELVAASALMLSGFFGGEAGISGNRVASEGLFGIDFGPQVQVYYLIAGWTFVCAVAMYALTKTPLGRMANAVRDNPERVQFIGYDTHRVRFYQMAWSAFFAGVAGSLAALNYELVTAENLSAHASGAILVMTYIGGIGQFFGPVLGAVFVTFLSTVLSTVTEAWPFYYGLLFLLIVLFAPGGISSLVVLHGPAWRARLLPLLAPSYAIAAATAVLLSAGAILLIEMAYHWSSHRDGSAMSVLGLSVDPNAGGSWAVAAALLAAGFALLRIARRAVSAAWQQVQDGLNAQQQAKHLAASRAATHQGNQAEVCS